MNAVPERLASDEIDPAGQYVCPLCERQSTADAVDTGWVFCPMVGGEPICLGCCIDHQGVARSASFDEHPFRALFDEVAAKTGRPAESLRQICLQHQAEIIEDRLRTADAGAAAGRLRKLLAKVERARSGGGR